MNKEKIINDLYLDFIPEFWGNLQEKGIEVVEITNDDIKNIIEEYFNKKTLTDAKNYAYNALEDYIDGSFEKIDRTLSFNERKETQAYKNWVRLSDIKYIWDDVFRTLRMDVNWVKINGKAHTDEDAATIAANKWCELLFGWHLQDNGALNETHAGGFPACALATVLADDAKKDISDEIKQKAYELFKEYYIRYIHYYNTRDSKDINWLQTTLESSDKETFNWEYGFEYDMYCDYDPSWALYTILYNAGVPEKKIHSICPWKTKISIRIEDNAVMYSTYQHIDEL